MYESTTPLTGLPRLAWYIRLYAKMIAQYLKVRMQYRADFIISTFGMLLINIVTLGSIWVILQAVPSLGGFRFEEMAFIYGFSLLAQSPMQIFFDNLWQIRFAANDGSFITTCFKPVPTFYSYMGQMIDLPGIGQFLLGLVTFLWAQGQLGIVWTAERLILLPVLLGGSSLVLIGLMTTAASGCFWIKDSFSILAFINGMRDHARLPLNIYGNALRFIFTWIIPVGFLAFYPSQLFLDGRPVPWEAWASPAFGLVCFWLGIRVWNAGVRHWGGTGS